MEFAENASAPSTSPSPIPPNFDWLADTGATSHMTPHRHWVRNYSPLRIPIKLADNSIVYSSEEGTVAFNPVMIDGKASQPVEFTRVLHVLSLQNKLLSCLYLAWHKEIIIYIDSEQMDFSLHGKSLFCAPIWLDNCAILSGSSAPLSESANWVSTLPLTLSLLSPQPCRHHQDAEGCFSDWHIICLVREARYCLQTLPCWQDALQPISIVSIAFNKTT